MSEPVRHHAELAVGLAGAALGAVAAAAIGGSAGLPVVAGAIVGGALGATWRRPRAAWLVAIAAFLSTTPDFDDLELVGLIFFPAHAFCAGRFETRVGGLAALVALIATWELAAGSDDNFVPGILLPATAWAAGHALRERELMAARLAERARELEQEREAHAALSVRYERARIASELHDIVAHALSVMVVQASAGQRLAARDPRRAAETLDAIAGAAREAETDMGRLVALLGGDAPASAAPDLALVEELVARAAGSGLHVTLRLEGDPAGVPATLPQAAYRVVQEGLTNALRHAAGAPVSVVMRGADAALEVSVENGPARGESGLAGAGTGNGLRGLRERVGACGGTLSAGPTADGGWRLAARVPYRVAASAP